MLCSSAWAKTFFLKACFACVFLLYLLTHVPILFASATEQIRIITTNDLHSYLKPIYYRYLDDIKPWGGVSREGDYVNKARIEGKIGGMAYVASMIKKLKAEKDVEKTGIFKVIGAEKTLENINNEINEITTAYESVHGNTKDSKLLKQDVKEVAASFAESNFRSGPFSFHFSWRVRS